MGDTFEMAALAFGPIVSIGIGWVLIWIAASRQYDDNPIVTRALNAVGAMALVAGICFGIIISAHMLGVFLLFAALIIGASAIAKFYVAERQSLLWVLTVAAEHGIPLESAARAFAEERNDVIGRRAKLLADYLEAGVPLSLALTRSRCSVTHAAQLAADLGQQTGTLGIGLRQATSGFDEGEATLRAMIEKLFYLIFLLVFGICVVTFIMLKITPVIARIMDEFELNIPPATYQLVNISDTLASGFVSVPLFGGAVAVFGLTVLCYIGVSPRQFPIVGRLWWSADCSLVMHWLAIAVRQDLPLGDMVRMLAAHFPQARLRRKLERASMRIDRGQDWRDSLLATGILRYRENGLFKSAERAGNLAWALDEMAQSGIRKSAYRIRAWTNVIFPALLCGFGAVVLFICLGTLLPLIALISGLA
ncbi:MAG: type II secretion system F family protein [Pirellulaceae bacterium]|jgi:type II secretory pathway component PulF|nr:type II secretion system F family protein [Pirellulaceae bacterium]MDP6720984.1 type II secretion system F family protein [Pirellulaceae bacterium]